MVNVSPAKSLPSTSIGEEAPVAPAGKFDDFLSQYSDLQQKADNEAEVSRSAQAGAMRRGVAKRREITSRMPEAPRAPTEFSAIPEAPQQTLGNPMNVFQTFAPALAVLASFKSRRPLVTSMNALGAAMEGYKEGDKAKYERNRQIWSDNLDVALKENDQMIKRYDLIRTQYGDDMARMEVELRLAAKEMGDEKTIAALSSPGGAAQALRRFEDMARLQVQLERASGKGRPMTAAESLADAMSEARKAGEKTGDWTRYNDLRAAAKLDTKGTRLNERGEIEPIPGAAETAAKLESSEAFAKKIGAESGAELFAKKDSAENALKTIDANNRALEIIDSGIISGFGAEYIVAFGKALRQVGFNFGGDDLSNTETFMVTRAQAVASIVKEFGAGVSISNADREYAEKAAAGKISLEKESLERILRISNDVSRQAVSSYERLLSRSPASAMPVDLSIRSAPADYSGGWGMEIVD